MEWTLRKTVRTDSARLDLTLLVLLVPAHVHWLVVGASLASGVHTLVYQGRPVEGKDECCSMHYS